MKHLTAGLAFVFFFSASWSQPTQLTIQGETGKLYLVHTVAAKENWYSVGRAYNISPKEIAPFNGLTLSKPLEIGQAVKIPLKSSNFTQHSSKAADETLIPIYHTIQEKEWMYHISTTYNKVPVESLEKWNHINKDQAKAGMQLIVGFLKVKTSQSPLASAGAEPMSQKEAPKTQDAIPVAKFDKQSEQTKKTSLPVETMSRPATDNPATNPEQVNTYSVSHSTGGYFSVDFASAGKFTNGQAGTFKSTSGWHDGKYYALMNNVAVGTIVKVSSPSTNKSIYAKVLGQLPEMKESTGLAIRISNAAAAELGTGEGRFPVEMKY